jgi:hypothetical protein
LLVASQRRDLVLNFVAGMILALVLFGLPVAIIGLFFASVVDRRNARPDQAIMSQPKAASSASEVNNGGRNRGAIVYGRRSVAIEGSGERSKLTRAAGRRSR